MLPKLPQILKINPEKYKNKNCKEKREMAYRVVQEKHQIDTKEAEVKKDHS